MPSSAARSMRLPALALTESYRPVLLAGEVERGLLDKVGAGDHLWCRRGRAARHPHGPSSPPAPAPPLPQVDLTFQGVGGVDGQLSEEYKVARRRRGLLRQQRGWTLAPLFHRSCPAEGGTAPPPTSPLTHPPLSSPIPRAATLC